MRGLWQRRCGPFGRRAGAAVVCHAAVFDTISKGFRAARERITGQAELTEDVINAALKDVRLSLLEADVEFGVVKEFLKRVQDTAVGELVHTRVKHKGGKKEVSAADHFINICHDELESLMGPVDTSIRLKKGHGVSTITKRRCRCGVPARVHGGLARSVGTRRRRRRCGPFRPPTVE